MNRRELLINDFKVLTIIAIALYILRTLFGTVCYSRLLWGIDCPFCGISRSLDLVIKGEFIEAYYTHPVIYFVIIWFIIFFLYRYFYKKTYNILRWYSVVCIILFMYIWIKQI